MDIYHGFFDLKDGQSDVGFADDLKAFLDDLVAKDRIVSWRLMRRKLGFGPKGLGQFHLMIEVTDLAQLDEAFQMASTREGDMEKRHGCVNSQVQDITFALFRDFPDPQRVRGDEVF